MKIVVTIITVNSELSPSIWWSMPNIRTKLITNIELNKEFDFSKTNLPSKSIGINTLRPRPLNIFATIGTSNLAP